MKYEIVEKGGKSCSVVWPLNIMSSYLKILQLNMTSGT